jgi:hypothetical protein
MIPDCCTDSVRLYTTTNFPYDWTFVSTLVTDSQRANPGDGFADPSVFYFNGYWWMFVSDFTNSNCYLYYSSSLASEWVQHPMSPIVWNDASRARPAGRIIIYNNGQILRFVQKSDVRYGEKVRAYQVDTLTTTGFAEHEIAASPLLGPSGSGWSTDAIHQIDPWWTGTNWIVSTDGHSRELLYSIGIYTTTSTPPTQIVFGNTNIGTIENYWGRQWDICKFQWNNPTGTYAGSITIYLSNIDSSPNNRMVVGIYDVETKPVKIAGSAEKTGLTQGWNTQTLTGTFTLTNGAWYSLYVHSPQGNNGRMATSSIAQHGWGDYPYDGTLPNTITLDGTEQTVCSIYATLTPTGSPPIPAYSLTVNTTPIQGLTIMASNSSFSQKIASGTSVNLQTGTYTITAPNSLALQYNGMADETWVFSAWNDGTTTSTKQFTLNNDTVLTATYIRQL